MKTVLVSGASVAGLTLAYWLRHHGYAPTVVERAPAVRLGGHAIDVRGVGLDVLDGMGLLADARQARTRMRGMTMLDGEGNELWSSTEMALSSGRLDGDDIELLREDLAQLLYGQACDGVEYLFGDSIATLEQDADAVHVGFERGPSRTFDLVLGADGLHSTVRRLAFGAEERFSRHLGSHVGVFSTDNFPGLDNWQVWLTGGGSAICLYPVRENSELRVTLGCASEPLDYGPLGDALREVERQKAFLADGLKGLGWHAPKLVKAMWEARDFYSDAIAQIHMDSWSDGRVALIGDAGYCPSPLSGQGTSLALVGAYVLAQELGMSGADGDHRGAFARYEKRLRPFVELNQALATENPGGPASEESLERAKNAITLEG